MVTVMATQAVDQYANYSDAMLLRLVHRKDLRAYERLYDRHAQVVFNLVVRIVGDASAAEELLQEVFWLVWQKAEQYDGSGAVGSWLCRIARNRALDHLRYVRAHPQLGQSEANLMEHSPRFYASSAESEVEQSWRRQQVMQALENIPDEQRLCLELAYFEGLSQPEVAQQTKTPLATVKTRLRIGMEKLVRQLRAVGYLEGEA